MTASAAQGHAAPEFLLATCQVGAERALKSEIARRWPSFHLAYSRPGFLTFKLPALALLSDEFDVGCVFARAQAFSLGKVVGATIDERAQKVRTLAGSQDFAALHVWQRDTATIGFRGFEPQITPLARQAEAAIRQAFLGVLGENAAAHPVIAQPGQLVLDCVLVEETEWWVGYHRARRGDSCFAGGLREIPLPSSAVSRAYRKMEESLQWSELPLRPGDRCVEIGCAPGGATQALLAHGLKVVGIDPAQVDPQVLADPNFTHVRKRGADVRRREFRNIAWLAADMNVAPQYTLDTVESIVTHPSVNVRGLLLTLKLLDWELAEHIDEYLDRVRGWGYASARARQLAYNRQEICLTARRKERKKSGTSAARQRSTPE